MIDPVVITLPILFYGHDITGLLFPLILFGPPILLGLLYGLAVRQADAIDRRNGIYRSKDDNDWLDFL